MAHSRRNHSHGHAHSHAPATFDRTLRVGMTLNFAFVVAGDRLGTLDAAAACHQNGEG
ncbi:MAG: hypothetical protein H9535_05610 [Ignavibacteria bacterium]|nr:hypothetical protein [Ignavibacteria bacterium]